jgi:hypothetical protein
MVSGIGSAPTGKSLIFGRIENVFPICHDASAHRATGGKTGFDGKTGGLG